VSAALSICHATALLTRPGKAGSPESPERAGEFNSIRYPRRESRLYDPSIGGGEGVLGSHGLLGPSGRLVLAGKSTDFSQLHAMAVGAAAISRHPETFGVGITFFFPSCATICCEYRKRHKAPRVSIWDRWSHEHWRLRVLEPPFTAPILEIVHQFLLFGIHRNDRLAVFQEGRGARVDVLKLHVSIHMLVAFAVFAVWLQALARPLQKLAHHGVTDLMSFGRQLFAQLTQTARSP
jgi:hypothetical protein